MTTEISRMSDAALDAAVASEVMCWHSDASNPTSTPIWNDYSERYETDDWHPTADIRDAKRVQANMVARGFSVMIECANGRFYVHVASPVSRGWGEPRATTEARAICEAALAAVRGEG